MPLIFVALGFGLLGILGRAAIPVLLVRLIVGLFGVAIVGSVRAARLRARTATDGTPPAEPPTVPPAG